MNAMIFEEFAVNHQEWLDVLLCGQSDVPIDSLGIPIGVPYALCENVCMSSDDGF